jgi:hypothetical protein
MKKLPAFMLTRKVDAYLNDKATKVVTPSATAPKLSGSSSAADDFQITPQFILEEKLLANSVTHDPTLLGAFSKLDDRFKKSLIDSFIKARVPTSKRQKKLEVTVSESAGPVIADLSRNANVMRVGLLDMGVWVGGLPNLLVKLNGAQSMFTVFEIQAAVPGGLVKTSEGMYDWYAEKIGKRLRKSKSNLLGRHMIADEFFVVAENIRAAMGLDLIVGLTTALIGGTESDGSVYYNHFSCVREKCILLSTADLREFSEEAGRPFEAAIGALLMPALLIAVNPQLGYHKDNNCLFDYNGNRVTLVSTLKNMQIDQHCMAEMSDEQRNAALAMVKAIKLMRRRKS